MESLYNRHHWEPTFCPLYQGVPDSGADSILPVGMVLHNWGVEHNMAAFIEFSFAVCCQAKAIIV